MSIMPFPLSSPSRLCILLGLIGSLSATAADGGADCCANPEGAIVRSQFIYEDAPYPASHASTIAEVAPGKLVAAWFGGTHERHPDVGIWFTQMSDGEWQEAREVANGVQEDGTRYPTWNPVLFPAPNGPLFLFYKVGPNPREWWGMVMTSDDAGESWSEPRRLPDGILGPIKNKPVVLSDGSWLSPSSTETPGVGWRLHFEHSTDRGETWKKIGPVDPGPNMDAIQPSILFHGDGVLQAVCRTKQGVVGSTWSQDNGKTWNGVGAIELPNPSSGTDAVTLEDGRHLLVYNHYAHMPEQPGKGLRYPLNLAISDDGVEWKMVQVLEDEPRPDGYAYPALIQTADGLVHITYTWDRKRIKHVVIDPNKL